MSFGQQRPLVCRYKEVQFSQDLSLTAGTLQGLSTSKKSWECFFFGRAKGAGMKGSHPAL